MAEENSKKNTIDKYNNMLENIRQNLKRGKDAYADSHPDRKPEGFFNYVSDRMYKINEINYKETSEHNPDKKKHHAKHCADIHAYSPKYIGGLLSKCFHTFPAFPLLFQYCDIFDTDMHTLLEGEVDYSNHFKPVGKKSSPKNIKGSSLIDKIYDDSYLDARIDIEDGEYYCYFPSFSSYDEKIIYEATMTVRSNPELSNSQKDVILFVPRRNSYKNYRGIMTIHKNNTTTINFTCTSDKNRYMIISIYHDQNSEDSGYYGSSGYLIDITSDGSNSPCLSKCILSTKQLSGILNKQNDCDKEWYKDEWFEGLLSIEPNLISIRKKAYLNTREECQLPAGINATIIDEDNIDNLSDNSILIIDVSGLKGHQSEQYVKNIRKFIYMLKNRSCTYCNSLKIESIDNRLVRMYIKYIDEK